jgi:peptidoglycan/LPS O-acetylase OafA/YrhL
MEPKSLVRIGKIEELESIRGIAAFLIVLFHITGWTSPLAGLRIVQNGYLMVDLFYVLSGFVIAKAYSVAINSPKQLLRFQFLRFGRLYPVHLFFLGVFVLFEMMKYIASTYLGLGRSDFRAFRSNGPVALIEQLLLFQAVGPTGNATTFNAPAWSISAEFYTYLIFGVIVLLFKEKKYAVFSAVGTISLALLLFEDTFGFEMLLQCFSGFFIGCMAFFVSKRIKFQLPSWIAPFAVAMTVLFLLLKKPHEYDAVIFALTGVLILSVVNSNVGLTRKLLRSRILTWMGKVSYSIYMSHACVLWITIQILKYGLHKPAIAGSGVVHLSIGDSIIANMLVIASVLIISHFTFSLIEHPIREGSRKLAARIWVS